MNEEVLQLRRVSVDKLAKIHCRDGELALARAHLSRKDMRQEQSYVG
jgi:hypothetical protein